MFSSEQLKNIKFIFKNVFQIPEYHEPICEDLDECELNLNNCDQTNTTCINKPGSYVVSFYFFIRRKKL
jgi:hypothetical protein